MHYIQLNITLEDWQVKIVKANAGKVKIAALAEMCGVTYNKMANNLKLMGLTHTRGRAKVIEMEGYFNVDECAKYYYY